MQVQVNWGPQNSSSTFRIQGDSLEAALEALNALEEWGSFTGSFTYKWTGDAQGNVSVVRLVPTYTIRMPVWPAYTRQPQSCKDAWDAMWRALQTHEDSHRQIFTQGIASLVRELEDLASAPGSDVDARIQRARDDIQNKHDEFDRETDHGKSRGVELVIQEECRRKQ
jgi:predicted secreted Zn-dependent protease